MASIFDPIADTLKDAINIYGQIEAVKLKTQLEKAQASNANYNQPTPQQDVQARASNLTPFNTGMSPLVIGGALLVGAVALYAIVK